MIKTAKQLKDLIRNLSKKKSADAQILMRNYMMERFLERISLSQYQDKFILKGGMLVAAMVGLDARATMDIISFPMEDGVTFRIKQITEIMDEAEYPGVRDEAVLVPEIFLFYPAVDCFNLRCKLRICILPVPVHTQTCRPYHNHHRMPYLQSSSTVS